MTLKALHCPSCGSKDVRNEGDGMLKCRHCDTLFMHDPSGLDPVQPSEQANPMVPTILAGGGLLVIVAVVAAVRGGSPPTPPVTPDLPPIEMPSVAAPRVTSAAAEAPEAPKAEVSALHQGETSIGGAFWIVHYENTGTVPIHKPNALVSLFDDAGNRVAEQRSWSKLEALAPGEETPVLVLISEPPDFARAEVTLPKPEPLTRAARQVPLQVSPLSTRADSGFAVKVTGTVTNPHEHGIRFTYLVLTGKNDAGEVIAYADGMPSSHSLDAGGESGFEMRCCTFGSETPSTFEVFAVGTKQ